MSNEEIIDIHSQDGIRLIWEKAQTVDGYNPSLYRKDACGAWIAYVKYGDTTNPYGWEIDHVYPQSRGGQNHYGNLRPMNWQNNRSKGNDYPSYQSTVRSDGNKNVKCEEVFTINADTQDIISKLYD